MNVTLIAAQSLDGFITHHDRPGSDFSSSADKVFFREALLKFDCRIMGSGTYRATRSSTRKAASNGTRNFVLTANPQEFESDRIEGRLEFIALPPEALVKDLETQGLRQCALIGGSKLHAAFLQAGLVDEIWLTVEPVLFGSGKKLVEGSVDVKLELISKESLSEQTLLLRYRVKKQERAR